MPGGTAFLLIKLNISGTLFKEINTENENKGHNGRSKASVGIEYVSYCKKGAYTAQKRKQLINLFFHKAAPLDIVIFF